MHEILKGPVVPIEELVDTVEAGLTPQRKKQVEAKIPHARRLFQKVRLPSDAWDLENPQNIEKGWLTIALAETDIRLLNVLYPNGKMARTPMAPTYLILHEFMVKAGFADHSIRSHGPPYPEWKEASQSISEILIRLSGDPDYWDSKNHMVIMFPWKELEAERKIFLYALRNDIGRAGRFAAVTMPFENNGTRQKAAFWFSDTTTKTKNHEFNHMDNPGILVGSGHGPNLFVSLNEAITEWRAWFQTPRPERPLWLSYEQERKLLGDLHLDGLYTPALHSHYERHSKETAIMLIQACINRYGLEGYLTLARAFPAEKKTESMERLGLLTTREVLAWREA